MFKAQIAGCGEKEWSENALTFGTKEEATTYARDLLSRWTGADMARVVPVETPNREPIDTSDPAIVLNYRRSV